MTLKRTGPVALTTTLTTNIYNPTQNEELRMIEVVNKTDLSATFSIWIGATGANAAGTEWFSKQVVAARSVFPWPYPRKLTAADFIVGGSDTTTALTITITTALAAN
jgi:hypothetical protein